jgi:hypothetical protein
VSGEFISQGNNLIGIGDGSSGFAHDVMDDLVGSAASPIDPRLEPLDARGGFHALMSDSPAIDKGSSDGAPMADQRGSPRPGGEAVDIGSYEL